MNTFQDYSDAALALAIYPGRGEALGLSYVALKMNGEAGEFAEHVGKAIRDDRFGNDDNETMSPVPLEADRKALLKKEIGDVLWYLAAAADELGSSLNEIAAENIAKLQDRKARGVLGGSGDNR